MHTSLITRVPKFSMMVAAPAWNGSVARAQDAAGPAAPARPAIPAVQHPGLRTHRGPDGHHGPARAWTPWSKTPVARWTRRRSTAGSTTSRSSRSAPNPKPDPPFRNSL